MSQNDLAEVFSLVKLLAEFEKEPDAVISNIQDYISAFEAKLIDGHVALDKGKVIGMTVYYEGFSTWKGKMLYLEDFYVLESYRSSGVGQQLFDEFIKEGKKRNCTMVKWQVLDWNTTAIRFYEKNNATIEQGWWNGKIMFDRV